ncbi:hypothetical protein MHYP_G00091080 [Metynnis hypsauchen]
MLVPVEYKEVRKWVRVSKKEVFDYSEFITESTTTAVDGPVDPTTARDIVKVALHSKPGGDQIFREYHNTSGLSDGTRRKMVNILVADMVEGHGSTTMILKVDTTGLVAQDFTPLFGEEVSGRFLAKWPIIFKPKIIADCKTIPSNSHVDDLLALALQESDHGWHSDLACILLLLHLLPPTSKGKKMGKISASEAEDRLVKFMRVKVLKVGMSMVTFLEKSGSAQPYLLYVGEKKNSVHNYYIILDQKAAPCEAKTAVAAFDELFKAHFVFAVSYDEALNNFTFIQNTVYGIDVGKAKESPRVKEIRVRLLRCGL